MLLVVGASGTIGSAVYHKAKREKISVLGTCRQGNADCISFVLGRDNPRGLLNALPKGSYGNCTAVIAAGRTNLRFCYEHPEESHDINVRATKELLSTLETHGIKTVYLSSDAVFDGRDGNYTETSATHPLSVYGRQKAIMEDFLGEKFPNALIYRLPKMVDENIEGNHIFADFYRNWKKSEPINCICGLRFNPTFLEDIADCILLGIKKELHGLYHVANPEPYTRAQLARKFFEKKDKDYRINESDVSEWNFSEPKPLDTTMNTDKFRQAVGRITFKGMNDVVRDFWSRAGRDAYAGA